MNKYETAIAEITNRAEHTLKTVISADTAQLAIEALGKQIPKKIKKADIDLQFMVAHLAIFWIVYGAVENTISIAQIVGKR